MQSADRQFHALKVNYGERHMVAVSEARTLLIFKRPACCQVDCIVQALHVYDSDLAMTTGRSRFHLKVSNFPVENSTAASKGL